MANLGVPIKLLHEALGHVVTCELKTGQVRFVAVSGFQTWLLIVLQLYRGTLLEGTSRLFLSSPSSASSSRCPLIVHWTYSGRLVQHLPPRNHRHSAGRPCLSTRAGVYPGKHGQVLYRAGYVGECADVSCQGFFSFC